MPKAPKNKYYAVRIGREGPKIYTDWEECKGNVSRFQGAVHKSFTSRLQAEEWIKPMLGAQEQVLRADDPLSGAATEKVELHLGVMTPPPSHEVKSTPHKITPGQISQSPTTSTETNGADVPKIKLSDEQNKVLQMVANGRSVFFTGSAGTGKSVLLREIIQTLGGADSSSLAITASTGIASVNIGGTTLHSWAGIGIGQEPAKTLAGKIAHQPKFEKVRERWLSVKTLIIDEISMIDGKLFDKLDFIARYVRRNRAPFGGIQLVLSGDFCQLPPVPDRKDGVAIPSWFAFEAESWDQCVGRPVHLTQVFRQTEQDFVEMLNAMRFGHMSETTIAKFKSLSRPVVYKDGIDPTALFATRREVDNANSSRLRRLPGDSYVFKASDVPGYDDNGQRVSDEQVKRLLERLVAPQSIALKIGAQVMLIKNLVQGSLVNGSVGKVIAFSSPREAIRDHTEMVKAENVQKAIAEAKTDPSVTGNESRWPVVQFTSGRQVLITPQEFNVNNAQGETEARREQVPLILAWALSVHKAQGQTIERVKVDLSNTFEKGQAYVALSRATSMATLQVLNFSPSKVMVHPRVVAWQNKQKKLIVDDDVDDLDDEHDDLDDEFDDSDD